MNLGKQGGKMLTFAPGEEKELSESTANAFEAELCRYVDGELLSVVTKKKAARVVDSIAEVSPTVTKKKAAKKKVARVAKE